MLLSVPPKIAYRKGALDKLYEEGKT